MRLQFRLVHFLFAIAVVAILFSFSRIRIQQQQLEKIEHLNSLCSTVSIYAEAVTRAESGIWFAAGGVYNKSLYNKGPISLLDWIFGDFSSLDVVGLDLSLADPECKTGSIPAVFAFLREFPNLREMDLSSTPLSDDDVELLVDVCPNLTHINASNTNLTNSALTSFSKLKMLQLLSVDGTAITGEGIGRLSEFCKELWYLEISSIEATSQGLAEIREWQSTKGLAISIADDKAPYTVTVYDPKKLAH